MRKGRDEGDKCGKTGRKKIKTYLVATNVVASRLPECRATRTPTACAKNEVPCYHKNRQAPPPSYKLRILNGFTCSSKDSQEKKRDKGGAGKDHYR